MLAGVHRVCVCVGVTLRALAASQWMQLRDREKREGRQSEGKQAYGRRRQRRLRREKMECTKKAGVKIESRKYKKEKDRS